MPGGDAFWHPLPGGGAVTPDDVRDAGRWEVVVTGVPAEAVTTEDGTDWFYTWVYE